MQLKLKPWYPKQFQEGCDDGDWRIKSITACQRYLKSLMPVPNPWPKSDSTSLRRFYGEFGDENNLVTITFPFPEFYEGKPVKTTRVHKKCAASFLRVLNDIFTRYHDRKDIMDTIADFSGVFNFRFKAGGGVSYSLHADGAAADFDADDNDMNSHWPRQADMPLEIIECFAREGWVSGGAFWGYDAMHFEATNIN